MPSKIELFPWNGTMRIPSKIQVGDKLFTPKEYLSICELNSINPKPVMDQLQSTAQSPNIELTPGAVAYLMNSVLLCELGGSPGNMFITPVRITEVHMLKEVKNYGFTYSHNLRHGLVCTADLLFGIKSNPYKCGKRIKLLTGFKVVGGIKDHPSPKTIGWCKRAPDGVIYCSPQYAARFRLRTNDGLFYRKLSTGDKLAGCLPNGWVIKGSVLIRDQETDMIVPEDSIKVKGALYDYNTRFWVKSMADDRIGFKPTSASYQILQFYHEILRDIIKKSLRSPWKADSKATWYDMIDGTAEIQDYIDLLSWETEAGERHHHPVVNIITGVTNPVPEITEAHANWLQYVVKPIIGKLEADNKNNKSTSKHKILDDYLVKSTIQRVLRFRMDGLINPRVKAVWGVLMPYIGGEVDAISLPKKLWYYLGCPEYVSALRFPVKGKSTLVRLRCDTHEGNSTIKVHPSIVDLVWNGDYDGDLIEVIASPKFLVDYAMDPRVALATCRVARRFVSRKLSPIKEKMKSLMREDVDKRTAQVEVAKWRGTIALATTWRDNLYVKLHEHRKEYNWSNYDIEYMLIKFMEAVMQRCLDQMDGGIPLGLVLVGDPRARDKRSTARMGRPDVVSKLTGIPIDLLVNKEGETDHWARDTLSELRNSHHFNYDATLQTLRDIAQKEPTDPHLVILSAFKDIKPW